MFDKKTKLMNFSVLISVYIKENPDYLREALDSIWTDQLLKPSEIVLVEDGPLTESLYNVISSFKDKAPIKIVKLNENVGLGPALQKGLAECSYELVARMDSDDISLPQRFKHQIDFMQDHPETSVLGSNIVEFDNTNRSKRYRKNVPEFNELILKKMTTRNPINHVTVMFRKKDVISSGGYKSLLYNEDYYLWGRMASNKFKFYNIQDELVDVRTSDEMYSRRGGFNYLLMDIKLQYIFKDLGIVSVGRMLSNIVIRGSVRIIPNIVRKYLYKLILRK